MRLTQDVLEQLGTRYDAVRLLKRELNGLHTQVVLSPLEVPGEPDGYQIAFCTGDIPYATKVTDSFDGVFDILGSDGAADDWEPVIE